MGGEPDVAAFARQRRAGDVADGQTQRARIAAGANDRRDAEPRNLEAAERRCRGAALRGYAALRAGDRRVGRGAARRRCAREDGVELAGLVRLVERGLGRDVAVVAEADDADDEQQALEPAEPRRGAGRTRVRRQRPQSSVERQCDGAPGSHRGQSL